MKNVEEVKTALKTIISTKDLEVKLCMIEYLKKARLPEPMQIIIHGVFENKFYINDFKCVYGSFMTLSKPTEHLYSWRSPEHLQLKRRMLYHYPEKFHKHIEEFLDYCHKLRHGYKV